MKLVRLGFLDPFWIERVGDWVYLFDYPSGQLIGKGFFWPKKLVKEIKDFEAA